MAQGWSVVVDGNVKPALTVDYLFRGVVIPEGKHAVVWSYRAPGLREGVWISVAIGVILLVLIIASTTRRSAERHAV
jgi:uncharacterized membrane protein YfhO